MLYRRRTMYRHSSIIIMQSFAFRNNYKVKNQRILHVTHCASETSTLKNITMNQNKCYFRLSQDQEKVEISFHFKVEDTYRQFNFTREYSDNLKTICERITKNIQKVFDKKSKKKGIKASGTHKELLVQICNDTPNPLPHEITCSKLFKFKTPLRLEIGDQRYDIIFNAPWIISFELSTSIIVGFPIYPEKLKTKYTEPKLCKFNWYCGNTKNVEKIELFNDNIEWHFRKDHYYYTPTINDMGMKIKLECVPVNSNCIGPAVEVISKTVVGAPLGYCPFETRHLFTSTRLNGKSFRCLSYNILADTYCNLEYTRSILHPYCPPYALEIDYRKNLILKEILGYNADIMCLQEVDYKVFKHCLQPFLRYNEFQGKFYKKGKTVAEGLSCFYRKNRFKLLEESVILLADALQKEECLQLIWNTIKHNEKLIERLLDRSTVASATVLQSCDSPNEVLLVGNTHLYFHPDADHIRLIQGGIIIYWLKHIRDKLKNKMSNKRVSIILCGDFNSVPSCGVYSLYTNGIAPDTLPDWQSNVEEAVTGLSLKQDIPLESACGTPEFTNFTTGFADCLDYIFYEKTNINVEQIIPLPSIEELTAHTALPSVVFPSDHIAIVADLQFKS